MLVFSLAVNHRFDNEMTLIPSASLSLYMVTVSALVPTYQLLILITSLVSLLGVTVFVVLQCQVHQLNVS